MSARLESLPAYAPMAEADLPLVLAIERAVYSHPWTEINFRDSIGSGYCCLVCRVAGDLAGYGVTAWGPGESHLLNISMAPAWQGLGYGRELLLQFCDRARENGAEVMFLEVRRSNQRAQDLYERFGFTRVGVRPGYYPDHSGREDAIIMRLGL